MQGDIRDGELVRREVKQSGAGVVFHLASYGMSGREQVSTYVRTHVTFTFTVARVHAAMGYVALKYKQTDCRQSGKKSNQSKLSDINM